MLHLYGHILYFEASLAEPSQHDIAAGEDSYCLIVAGQRSAYGSIAEVGLRDRVLRLVIKCEAIALLGLDDPEIEATLDVDDEAIDRLRKALRYILNDGRPGARPTLINL